MILTCRYGHDNSVSLQYLLIFPLTDSACLHPSLSPSGSLTTYTRQQLPPSRRVTLGPRSILDTNRERTSCFGPLISRGLTRVGNLSPILQCNLNISIVILAVIGHLYYDINLFIIHWLIYAIWKTINCPLPDWPSLTQMSEKRNQIYRFNILSR